MIYLLYQEVGPIYLTLLGVGCQWGCWDVCSNRFIHFQTINYSNYFRFISWGNKEIIFIVIFLGNFRRFAHDYILPLKLAGYC